MSTENTQDAPSNSNKAFDDFYTPKLESLAPVLFGNALPEGLERDTAQTKDKDATSRTSRLQNAVKQSDSGDSEITPPNKPVQSTDSEETGLSSDLNLMDQTAVGAVTSADTRSSSQNNESSSASVAKQASSDQPSVVSKKSSQTYPGTNANVVSTMEDVLDDVLADLDFRPLDPQSQVHMFKSTPRLFSLTLGDSTLGGVPSSYSSPSLRRSIFLMIFYCYSILTDENSYTSMYTGTIVCISRLLDKQSSNFKSGMFFMFEEDARLPLICTKLRKYVENMQSKIEDANNEVEKVPSDGSSKKGKASSSDVELENLQITLRESEQEWTNAYESKSINQGEPFRLFRDVEVRN